MTNLSQIETIIIVMLENRSFDHMLGHLSYRQYRNGTTVDGLQSPLENDDYSNPFELKPYYPWVMRDGGLRTDLPHESEFVARQLNSVAGQFGMDGFVEAYNRFTQADQTESPECMGFLPPGDVPITTFLANEYAVCDRWFAPFPTSTQPNKIMALTGDSPIVNSQPGLPMIMGSVNIGPTLFDWLNQRTPSVPWRIYSCGISFLTLVARCDLLDGGHWRPFAGLADDFAHEDSSTFPNVIYVEPEFGDSPIHLTHHPCDNHPPLAVGFGEDFLRTVYAAITSSVGFAPERWEKTVMIVTYDEHGGFFDHVPPLPVEYAFAPGSILPPGIVAPFKFSSTGLRVPSIVVSPLVGRQTVFHEPMDHTSILQLLAQKWGDPVSSFSPTVRGRRDDNGDSNIVSVSRVLKLDEPRPAPAPAAPDVVIAPTAQLGSPAGAKSTMQLAFDAGARAMVDSHPELARDQLPGLTAWARQRGN